MSLSAATREQLINFGFTVSILDKVKAYCHRFLHLVLGVVMALFLWHPGSSMAEDNMCTNLQRVNNLDEMLYQFYSNLDSDCLFTMPLAELEEAWDIKILSEERLQPGQSIGEYSELRNSADFNNKPYRSEADAYFVQAYRRDNRTTQFSIHITRAYAEAHMTLFPEGNFPRLLPDPIERTVLAPPSYHNYALGYVALPQLPNPGRYRPEHLYFWLNSDHTRMILISTRRTPSVGGITIHSRLIPDFVKNYITE